MRRLWKFGAFAALATAAFSIYPAQAGEFWSTVAATCVPDSKSIQGNRYKLADTGAIAFSSKNVKPITLNCLVPVQTGINPPEELSMTFKDSTAASQSGGMKATLFAVNRLTGASQAMSVLGSDTTAATGVQQVTDPNLEPDLFDFAANSYFIRVVMKRSKTSQDVRLYGLSLTSTCGNGRVGFGDQCDDGDTTSGDGCSAACEIEDGFQCSGTPSVCFPVP